MSWQISIHDDAKTAAGGNSFFATLPIEELRDCPCKYSGKNPGTVPELVRETIAMNWAVGGGIERRFHPKDRFKDQFRRLLSRLGAHRMR